MNEIKGFTFFKSYYDSLKNLKKSDQKEIIFAMLEYVFDDKIPNFLGVKRTIWTLIEPNLLISKKRSNSKSGAPLGNQNARKYWEEEEKQKQSKINQNLIKKQIVTSPDKEGDKDKDKEREWEIYSNTFDSILEDSFSTPHTPTLSELRSFCLENDMSEFDCEYFFNYYEANGWTNKNGTRVKNWQARVKNWYADDVKNGKIKKKPKYDTRRINEDENGRLFQFDEEGNKIYVSN